MPPPRAECRCVAERRRRSWEVLSLAMPYLTDNPDTAFVVRERVRNGELMQLKALIKEGVDFKTCFLAPAPTVRGYTPLHIAAWGTAKPN